MCGFKYKRVQLDLVLLMLMLSAAFGPAALEAHGSVRVILIAGFVVYGAVQG